MQSKILGIVNLVLILVCVWCVWYLSTKAYEEPREIGAARALLETGMPSAGSIPHVSETGLRAPNPPIPTSETRRDNYNNLPPANPKNVFASLFTPTPSPTPPPTPPPPKGDLGTAVYSWSVSGLEENKATFIDSRAPAPQEPFEMTVGGPPVEAKDKSGLPVQVLLIAVDMNEFKAVLGFEDQRKEIKY